LHVTVDILPNQKFQGKINAAILTPQIPAEVFNRHTFLERRRSVMPANEKKMAVRTRICGLCRSVFSKMIE
jgi:hypothetical protein